MYSIYKDIKVKINKLFQKNLKNVLILTKKDINGGQFNAVKMCTFCHQAMKNLQMKNFMPRKCGYTSSSWEKIT